MAFYFGSHAKRVTFTTRLAAELRPSHLKLLFNGAQHNEHVFLHPSPWSSSICRPNPKAQKDLIRLSILFPSYPLTKRHYLGKRIDLGWWEYKCARLDNNQIPNYSCGDAHPFRKTDKQEKPPLLHTHQKISWILNTYI